MDWYNTHKIISSVGSYRILTTHFDIDHARIFQNLFQLQFPHYHGKINFNDTGISKYYLK